MSYDDRTQTERDLYLRLLELAHSSDIERLLSEVLRLAVSLTSAERGHIHVFGDHEAEVEWSMVDGVEEGDGETARAATSRGIEVEAITSGKLVFTLSARRDPRFESLESVRKLEIESVICAPLGGEEPVGVLYLHGAAHAFSEADKDLIELLARHVGPSVRWVSDEARRKRSSDPTAALRQRLSVSGLRGTSTAIARLFELIASVAPLNVSVLLEGPSGTGKSRVARAIHDNSPRRDHTFVDLNCGAIPETLFESELFGAHAGAHSNAQETREGKIAAADKGTLFLDEVGELSLASQVKLLKFLDEGRYYRLGKDASMRADVRVIAATNRDLAAMVAAREFREDLYHRLRVVSCRVPSLAERDDDIDELSDHFRDEAAERNGLPRLPFSSRARIAIRTGQWPGNIRQLSNAVESALIFAAQHGATEIAAHHVYPERPKSEREILTYAEGTRECQRRIVKEALDRTNWNIMEAARQLDVARSHLYNLIKAFDLSREP